MSWQSDYATVSWPLLRNALMVAMLALMLKVSTGHGQERSPSIVPSARETTPQADPRRNLSSPVPESFEWISRDNRPSSQLDRFLDYDTPSRLFMSISLTQAYSDNFEQEYEDKQEEYETKLTLGTSYRVRNAHSFLFLRNTLSTIYEARNEFAKIGFANLSLNTGYDLKYLKLALNETLVIDDDQEEASASGIRRGRSRFLRHAITPQMRYTLDALTSAAIAYTNTIVLEEAEDRSDSITHKLLTQLERRLTRNVTVLLGYTFTYDDDQDSTPSQEHEIAATVKYTLNRALSLLAEYFWTTHRGGTESDSLRYGGQLGFKYQWTPSLSFFVTAGIAAFDDNSRNLRAFFTWQAGFNGAIELTPTTHLRLSSSQTLESTDENVDDVGIVLQQNYRMSLDQRINSFLQGSLFANFARTKFLERTAPIAADEVRENFFVSTGVKLSYTITQNLLLQLEYQHRRRDSNISDDEYIENNVMLRLSNRFSFF